MLYRNPCKRAVRKYKYIYTNHFNTHWPSRAGGGFRRKYCMSVKLLASTTQSVTSGFVVPGVGYRTFLVSGNELSDDIPLPAIIPPDASHGYVIILTLLSLKEAYMKCVPSCEPHIASGFSKISSIFIETNVKIYLKSKF